MIIRDYMLINKKLSYLKTETKKLKMSKQNRKVYFKNIKQDLNTDPNNISWEFFNLYGPCALNNKTAGANTGTKSESLPNLSQYEGTYE